MPASDRDYVDHPVSESGSRFPRRIQRFAPETKCITSLLSRLEVEHLVLAMPNVRAKRAATAGRQARAGENVHRTTGPGPCGLPLVLRLSEGLGLTGGCSVRTFDAVLLSWSADRSLATRPAASCVGHGSPPSAPQGLRQSRQARCVICSRSSSRYDVPRDASPTAGDRRRANRHTDGFRCDWWGA